MKKTGENNAGNGSPRRLRTAPPSEKGAGESNIFGLAEIHKIKAENINADAYFMSLADNALDAGLLSEKDMTDIQSQIYDILSDNIWMYTNGTSTSVTSKEANNLVLAILHVLDSFCISEAGSPGININEIKLVDLIKIFKEKAGIKKCYEKGLEFLNKTSAQEIVPEIEKKETEKISKLYDEYYKTIDFQELDELEKSMGFDFEENNIVSQSAMTDMEFNLLCVKISKCKTAEKKAALIIESVSSAADFLDILNAQCLFGDEYLALYKKLSEESPETIEFLVKNLGNKDDEWQIYLLEFLEI